MIKPAPALSESTLVGRQPEMALLWGQFQVALEGHLRVALVAGEPGIGKSQLLATLAIQAEDAGAIILRGGASEAEGMPPYLPFLEALGPYIRATSAETLREQAGAAAAILATILPELTLRLGELASGYPLPPEQARLRLYEAVGDFIVAVAAPNALVLLLDDLHWADAASLDLLGYIARRQAAARLLIVGAYREGEAADSPFFQRTLAELTRLRVLTTVIINPLSAEDVAALAASYLVAPLDPAANRLLGAQSEGNPFFAEEILRNWLETGAIKQVGRHWILADPSPGSLPQSIVSAVRQRLARLAPEVVECLRAAAIIGRTFEVTFLAEVLGQEEEQVEERLQIAVQARLLRAESAGVFTFSHDTIRECLYGEITSARRKRWHGFIGRALESQGEQNSAQQLADLAFHFTRSGDRSRGVSYAQRAAQQATRAYAPAEAMRHYQAALNLLDLTDQRRGELFQTLGEAAVLAGAERDAVTAFEAAQSWFTQTGDALAVARAAHGLGRALWRLESLAAAQIALETALTWLNGLPQPTPEKVQVLVDLGSLLAVSLHQQHEGIAYSRQALELAHQLEEENLIAMASRTVGNLLVRSNDLAAGLSLLEQALALAAAADPVEAAECCACLAMAYVWNGTPQRFYEFVPGWLAFARRSHDPYQLRHIYSLLAMSHIFRGQWREAEQMLTQAQAIVERLASPEPLAFLGMTRAMLAYHRGDAARAEVFMAEAVTMFREIGPGALVWYLGLLGLIQTTQGKSEAAQTCLVEVEALMAGLPLGSIAISEPLTHLTLIALALDDRGRLARYYPQLVLFRGQFHDAIVDRLLGAIETFQGDWPTAQASLTAAENAARQADFKLELVYTLEAQANLELAQGGRGNHDRAQKLLDEAQALCRQFDLAGAERHLRDRLHLLSPRSQPALPAGLSQREVEVLCLVAAGKSNRQIAGELVLSEKTVANHLTHIFNKTSVDNRAAATAFAIRHNLV